MTQQPRPGLQLRLTQTGRQPLAPGPPGPRAPGPGPSTGPLPPPPLPAHASRTGFLESVSPEVEPGWRLGPQGSGLGSQMGAGWPGLESGIRPLSWHPEEARGEGEVGRARRQGWSPLPEPAFLGKSRGSPPYRLKPSVLPGI